MDEKKKISIMVVVSNCFCAIVWNLNLIVDFVSDSTNSDSLVLHILCAIAWNMSAIMWIFLYRKSKKESDK